jgi:hypothetical protein
MSREEGTKAELHEGMALQRIKGRKEGWATSREEDLILMYKEEESIHVLGPFPPNDGQRDDRKSIIPTSFFLLSFIPSLP